jgi:uncharacterized RDD family membrane protein YckC
MAKPYNCKTLYGVRVCSKCRNGFANRRQAAYLVDGLLYVVAVEMIVFLVASVAMASAASADFEFSRIASSVLSWVVFPLVFTLKDAFNGRSAGKMLFGVRVVDIETRQPITALQSVKRNLVLMIPYVGVIGGAITMMRGQRWGEKWAGTMVVWNKRAFRVPFARDGRFCRSCGYDLTGNTSGRCPECGLEVAAAAPVVSSGVGTPVE